MSSAAFSLQRIEAAVEGTLFHGNLHHYSTVDSTNLRALADAESGATAGQVYIADEQTAGRGRGGHTWHSQPERGLYLTVLLRPALPGGPLLHLSLAAGIAAVRALERVTGFRADLRWPNDVVAPAPGAGSRKLGGILTEAAMSPSGIVRHAAVGIGINLNQTEFPAELSATATSMRLASGVPVSREAVAVALLQELHGELERLATGDDGDVLQRFQQHSSWVWGKQVTVDEDGGYTGETAGLTPAGLLLVRCVDGTERTVRHGGVREAVSTEWETHAAGD